MKTLILLTTMLFVAPALSQGQFVPYDTSSAHAKKRIADHAKLRSALTKEDREYLKVLSSKYRPLLIKARDASDTEEMERLRSEQFGEMVSNLSPAALQAILSAKTER